MSPVGDGIMNDFIFFHIIFCFLKHLKNSFEMPPEHEFHLSHISSFSPRHFWMRGVLDTATSQDGSLHFDLLCILSKITKSIFCLETHSGSKPTPYSINPCSKDMYTSAYSPRPRYPELIGTTS